MLALLACAFHPCPDSLGEDVAAAMGPPLPAVDANDSVDEVFADLTGGGAAVVVVRSGKPLAVRLRPEGPELEVPQQVLSAQDNINRVKQGIQDVIGRNPAGAAVGLKQWMGEQNK